MVEIIIRIFYHLGVVEKLLFFGIRKVTKPLIRSFVENNFLQPAKLVITEKYILLWYVIVTIWMDS